MNTLLIFQRNRSIFNIQIKFLIFAMKKFLDLLSLRTGVHMDHSLPQIFLDEKICNKVDCLKGCNTKLLPQLYQSLIRFHLDYGAPIYNLAIRSVLKLPDPIQTQALRFGLGAFRNIPRLSYRWRISKSSGGTQKKSRGMKEKSSELIRDVKYSWLYRPWRKYSANPGLSLCAKAGKPSLSYWTHLNL